MRSEFNESAAMPRPAMRLLQPILATPGEIILREEGDQARRSTAPNGVSPDRNNPASAGGVDHMNCDLRSMTVDANLSRESEGSGAQAHTGIHLVRSPVANHSGEPGRDEASLALAPITSSLRHDNFSDGQVLFADQFQNAAAGDERAHPRAETLGPASPLIAEITQLVRMRRRWHKAEKSLVLQGKALCRSWTAGDKDEANRLFDLAINGSVSDPFLTMALAPFMEAKAKFEAERLAIEKTLRKLARSLPIWKAWVEGVKGFGELRLAVLVGECGDFAAYRNPSCLWKRMGLAVISGQRQRRVSDAEQAVEHGYNPERRAIAYVMATELLKAQIRNVKDADGKRTDQSIAIGPYGQVYLDRKAYEAGRGGITKAHANNRAARYMVKRVLRDLYAASRQAA
jgi:hypothetical protein